MFYNFKPKNGALDTALSRLILLDPGARRDDGERHFSTFLGLFILAATGEGWILAWLDDETDEHAIDKDLRGFLYSWDVLVGLAVQGPALTGVPQKRHGRFGYPNKLI